MIRERLAISSPLSTTAGRVTQVRSIKWSILKTDRSLPHFGRKLYHMLSGLICVALYAFVFNREQTLLILSGVGGIWIAADLLRLRVPAINNLTMQLFGRIMRREELKRLSANTFYILGMYFVVFFFSKPVVLLSVLCLAVGDPVAAVVGTLVGRHPLVGKKSLEGAVANFLITGSAIFLMGLVYFQLSLERGLVLAGIGGLVSVFAELTPLPVNDNFSIPLIAGTLFTLVNAILPLF